MAGRENPAWRRRLAGAVLAGGLSLVVSAPASGATLQVTNTNNAGAGSLRKAIAKANDEVDFPGKDVLRVNTSGTVALESPLAPLSSRMVIAGPGAEAFAVTRAASAPLSGIFVVTAPGKVRMSGLAVKKGEAFGANGGGIRNEGTLTLKRVLVTRNSVDAGAGTAGGGGIFNQGTLRVVASTISKNEVSGTTPYGSGIYSFGTTLLVRGSTLSENVGNGALNVTTDVTVENSTISDNDAIGIVTGGGTTTLRSSTIASNDGIPSFAYNITVFNLGTTMSSQNTIVGPPTGSGNCYLSDGTLTSNGHNLSSDGSCGFTGTGDQLDAEPKLAPLANNGGPTKTREISASSDAHDAGKSAGLGRDQRGRRRPVDHGVPNAPGGNGADIGAFERQ